MKHALSFLFHSCSTSIVVALCVFHVSRVTAQTLSLTRPNGGEIISASTAYTITWNRPPTARGLLSISIWNGDTGLWTVLSENVSIQSGRFVWNVPPTMQGDRFRIKIQSQNNPSLIDLSDTFFSIVLLNNPSTPQDPLAQEQQSIRVVPNPAHDYADASWVGEALWLRVWDIPGHAVLFYPLNRQQRHSFSVARLISGMYMVEVALANGSRIYGKVFVVP